MTAFFLSSLLELELLISMLILRDLIDLGYI